MKGESPVQLDPQIRFPEEFKSDSGSQKRVIGFESLGIALEDIAGVKETLEDQGWSMGDIVQVRAFALAGEDGLDFAGFNSGYSEFFGTSDNPNKPVRSFVEIKDLVVEGWLVEIEIRAARMP